MPRQPRFLPPNNYFHIIYRSNNQISIFNSDQDFQYYLSKLTDLKKEHPFDLFHYCLMPTHIHLLLKVKKKTDFSTFSKRLNLSYSIYFHKNYNYNGLLWQGRFRSQLISNDSYFLQCGKYIELNPVKAKIAKKPKDYKWSSYNHYAYGILDNLLSEDIFYFDLGKNAQNRQLNYRKMIIDESVKRAIDSDAINLSIGNKKFIYNKNRSFKQYLKK